MKNSLYFFLILLLTACQSKQDKIPGSIDWKVAELPGVEFKLGEPVLVDTKLGPAVQFFGQEAFFLNTNPLAGMKEVTVEAIFRPDADGPFEQRFLHLGEVSGERIMLETRVKPDGNWYFDAYVKRPDSQGYALIDSSLTHPGNRWYQVAFVCRKDSLFSYVNGQLEKTAAFSYQTINKGLASVGVRQNKVCFFKGQMYRIRITPKALNPEEFLQDHLILNTMNSPSYLMENKLPWTDLGGGVKRQILGYDQNIMLVKVAFEQGSVGAAHKHPHSQSSLCVSGKFEVDINGQSSVISAGDGFYVAPDLMHGVRCLEAGVLLDAFAPCREDFLP
ncbi:MAG: cupin domain-containing protein [Bacteroidales bacterium]|jgi:quercetin dioxygenase-like cupin family protein|nr:cupin domain-containing protein [Bacteroidales bacterium]